MRFLCWNMSDVSVLSVSEDLCNIFSKVTIERARRARTNIENYYRWGTSDFICYLLNKTCVLSGT